MEEKEIITVKLVKAVKSLSPADRESFKNEIIIRFGDKPKDIEYLNLLCDIAQGG